uniref:Transmembrane protein 33 n=1 Tax=Angiostrongylus cantonensis TaxID=6313 RepID=A0A0K0DI08_ANGCA
MTRLATLFFAICYLLPFLSPVSSDSAYYKAFAAAAATNALRMQQRVGLVSFSREFFARLLLEDSCHYLFYSILFLTSAPVTMTLLSITLFAALHAASQLVKLLTAIGHGGSNFTLRLASFSQQHTANCLGIIACGEIFLIPVGKASLFVPFIYYRFLTLRYSSRRNPNTRQAFAQMRYSLDQVAASASCPQIVRSLIYNSISLISRLAPAI